jgi:ABC-type sugar transport system, permease component
MANAYENRHNSRLTILLFLLSAVVFFPLFVTFMIAVKNPEQMARGILSLPDSIHWENFVNAAAKTGYFSALKNSAFATATVLALTVATNSFVAYGIARNWHRKFFRFLYFYFISAMFIPFQVIMLPIVKQMSFLGMDHLLGIVFLYAIYGLPFNTFVYVGYLRSMPVDIEEAARIDGAGTWAIFWRVVFPIMAPMNATVGILTALWVWNDFMLPLVIISNKAQYTLPLVQYVFQQQFSTDYNLAFASYFLVMTPIIIVYLFGQKGIIKGVMSGSLKG